MKLVMTLLVRDEEEIVAANLDYHFAQGVDFAIVTDNGSVDGTVEILRRYEDVGRLRLLHYPLYEHQQAELVTSMARLAAIEEGADWVINNDADEFWWPRRGDLRSTLSEVDPSVDVLVARRSNFLSRPSTKTPFYSSMIYRETRSLNPLGKPLPPKVCHRARTDISVAPGNHAVTAPGLGETLDHGDLEVFHFPARSYAQFERKVVNSGSAYEANTRLPPGVGNAQRWLYRIYKAGGLRRYYESQVLDEATLSRRLASGEIVEDTRLRDFFRAMNR